MIFKLHPAPESTPRWALSQFVNERFGLKPSQQISQGRNIKRFREMLGIKQEALAFELGEDWNQKKTSLLEQKEEIEASLLSQIAEVLKLPVEAFQNFEEEQAVNIISNTFHNGSIGYQKNDNCTSTLLIKSYNFTRRKLPYTSACSRKRRR